MVSVVILLFDQNPNDAYERVWLETGLIPQGMLPAYPMCRDDWFSICPGLEIFAKEYLVALWLQSIRPTPL